MGSLQSKNKTEFDSVLQIHLYITDDNNSSLPEDSRKAKNLWRSNSMLIELNLFI